MIAVRQSNHTDTLPLVLPCPASWRRVLRARDWPFGTGVQRTWALASWLVACGWDSVDGELWRHSALRRPRTLSEAALAAATMQAQPLLEERGWWLSCGVVAKRGPGPALWVEALEVGRRSRPLRSQVRVLAAALSLEGFDIAEAPAPLSPVQVAQQ